MGQQQCGCGPDGDDHHERYDTLPAPKKTDAPSSSSSVTPPTTAKPSPFSSSSSSSSPLSTPPSTPPSPAERDIDSKRLSRSNASKTKARRAAATATARSGSATTAAGLVRDIDTDQSPNVAPRRLPIQHDGDAVTLSSPPKVLRERRISPPASPQPQPPSPARPTHFTPVSPPSGLAIDVTARVREVPSIATLSDDLMAIPEERLGDYTPDPHRPGRPQRFMSR